MIGHQPIIELRLKYGLVPPIVFVNDFRDPVAVDWHNPGASRNEVWAPDHATVSTFGDSIERLDFRFLSGLWVSIAAVTEIRTKRLFQAIVESGATKVVATHWRVDLTECSMPDDLLFHIQQNGGRKWLSF